MTTQTSELNLLSPASLLHHWQGHRRLTRRTIEAFPEEPLFHYTLGGMRPFSEMVWELLRMAVPIAEGVATGRWQEYTRPQPTTKSGLLELWDEQTAALNRIFPTIPHPRFEQTDRAFDKWENVNLTTILYAVDNEIHHRGEGYVYLRSLGIEPPPFWDRFPQQAS